MRLYETFPIGETLSFPEKSGSRMLLSFCCMVAIPSCLPRKRESLLTRLLTRRQEKMRLQLCSPYSMPLSVILTSTPGLTLEITGIKVTISSQPHRNMTVLKKKSIILLVISIILSHIVNKLKLYHLTMQTGKVSNVGSNGANMFRMKFHYLQL